MATENFTPSIEEDEPPFSDLEDLADNIDPEESAQHWRDRQSGDDGDDDFLNILDAEELEDEDDG
jgi:hypothetical protein